jgi:hypothetical protein
MGKPSGSTIMAKSQSSSEEIAKAFAAGVVRKSCPLYPPKADIRQRDRDVRFVPKADIQTIVGYD